jgi:hypothetical protein
LPQAVQYKPSKKAIKRLEVGMVNAVTPIVAGIRGNSAGQTAGHPNTQRIRVCALAFIVAAFVGSGPTKAQEGRLSVTELKKTVLEAVSDARKLATQPPYFLVKEVKIEVQGTSQSGGGVGFSIKVFGVGADLGTGGDIGEEAKLTIALTPATTIITGGGPKIDLTTVIAGLRKTFARAKTQTPDYYVKLVNYEVVWALKRNEHGGIDFKVASANVRISKKIQQKIIFTLCETVNLRDCVVK